MSVLIATLRPIGFARVSGSNPGVGEVFFRLAMGTSGIQILETAESVDFVRMTAQVSRVVGGAVTIEPAYQSSNGSTDQGFSNAPIGGGYWSQDFFGDSYPDPIPWTLPMVNSINNITLTVDGNGPIGMSVEDFALEIWGAPYKGVHGRGKAGPAVGSGIGGPDSKRGVGGTAAGSGSQRGR